MLPPSAKLIGANCSEEDRFATGSTTASAGVASSSGDLATLKAVAVFETTAAPATAGNTPIAWVSFRRSGWVLPPPSGAESDGLATLAEATVASMETAAGDAPINWVSFRRSGEPLLPPSSEVESGNLATL